MMCEDFGVKAVETYCEPQNSKAITNLILMKYELNTAQAVVTYSKTWKVK
jgi:hypothetical protein